MSVLENNFNGIQHIGIPVTDLEKSKSFYKSLDFLPVMEAPFQNKNGMGQCCMVKCDNTIIELYQLPKKELLEIYTRKDGHIDHIAFDVKDIEVAYQELKEAGFEIEAAPTSLGFWDNGCSYFTVIGPNKERLEFNQTQK
jgi:catechol 2,3-dioxygenase-like lactoylglutathione lyase family enzyme